MDSPLEPRPGLTCLRGDPLACYRGWRQEVDTLDAALLLVEFELSPYWLDESEPQLLNVLYLLSGNRLRVAVTDRALDSLDLPVIDMFEHWVSTLELAVVAPGQALPLLPVTVDKPWGREIWYSAAERRGICQVQGGAGRCPLPWVQATLPDEGAGPPDRAPMLLKILDPDPEPVHGELYFELHESKWEVYVVTDVDQEAWPEGRGYMRYGFSPRKRQACGSDASFRAAYLAAVEAYRAVRAELDDETAGSEADASLLQREQSLREEMDSFTRLRPLIPGDAVVVPPGLPHALLHGVRVVEVQTPVYERRILSFAQKVITQDHWDTAEALDDALLDPPETAPFTSLSTGPGVCAERIVVCPDFEVSRLSIAPDSTHDQGPLADYALVMILGGKLELHGALYGAGDALLLTRGWAGRLTPAQAAQPLDLLLATPAG